MSPAKDEKRSKPEKTPKRESPKDGEMKKKTPEKGGHSSLDESTAELPGTPQVSFLYHFYYFLPTSS